MMRPGVATPPEVAKVMPSELNLILFCAVTAALLFVADHFQSTVVFGLIMSCAVAIQGILYFRAYRALKAFPPETLNIGLTKELTLITLLMLGVFFVLSMYGAISHAFYH